MPKILAHPKTLAKNDKKLAHPKRGDGKKLDAWKNIDVHSDLLPIIATLIFNPMNL
jgi:hypothetical protein